MKKFEQTGLATNIVQHCFVCSAEKSWIAIVSEGVTEDPNGPIPRRSQALGLS